LPAGTTESSLCMATWDTNTGTYTSVDCQVDTEANRISTSVSHFSQYTILSAPRPAEFTLSELSISPVMVSRGDTVSISVVVTNTGDVSGNYTCSLMINNVIKDSKQVTINANEKTTLHFNITAGDDGIYNISIGSLEGTFNVQSTPASFEISSLEISPSKVDIGEKADISITITNKGQSAGFYEIKLNVNGAIVDTKVISLSGGASRQVNFTLTADIAGKKIIDVNGLIGGLVVRGEVPPPVQIPLPAEEPQPAPEVTTPSEPQSILPAEQGITSGTIWILIAGISCGCLVLAACVLYFTWWRRRSVSK